MLGDEQRDDVAGGLKIGGRIEEGGEFLGAGGGGFLLFLAPPDRHDDLKKAFTGFHTLDVEIGVPGSEVIFNAAAARPHPIPFKL